MVYIIDAHSLLWFIARDPQLSPTAAGAMRDPTARLIVPTIALAELQHSYGRHRIRLSPAQLRGFVTATRNAAVHPFDLAVLDRLPPGLELHDGIIVATALVFRDGGTDPVRLITRDKQITASGLVEVLW